jgi:hypothetical protein
VETPAFHHDPGSPIPLHVLSQQLKYELARCRSVQDDREAELGRLAQENDLLRDELAKFQRSQSRGGRHRLTKSHTFDQNANPLAF